LRTTPELRRIKDDLMLDSGNMGLIGSLCVATFLSFACQSSAQQLSKGNVSQRQTAQTSAGNRAAQVQALTPQQQAALQAEQLASTQTPVPPQRPFPELPPQEIEYLNQFLDYWQQSSQRVKQYVCDFRRYEYDSAIVNYRDPDTQQLAAHAIAVGEIRFAQPDKGRYEASQIWDFQAPPSAPGEAASYDRRGKRHEKGADSEKERWICDGRSIYEFDFENKRLYESEIPKEMQGAAIVNSPIPFLFGADKEKILERYWVRVIPKGVETEYWLEAYPKKIEDARVYSKIEVILAKEDFLPKAMHVYSSQYDPARNNFQSQYYAFENRRVNDQLDQVKNFFGYFVRPQKPIGWERVNRRALAGQQSAQLPAGMGNSTTAKSGAPIR
jgi:TIGR03009 family protein